MSHTCKCRLTVFNSVLPTSYCPLPTLLSRSQLSTPWRYALNENVDGYSAPYWDQKRWQHEIDILALSGTTLS